MNKPTVGFIGLGIMGKAMALNVLKAGFPLVVHNRSHGPVEELVVAGAEDGGSPNRWWKVPTVSSKGSAGARSSWI